MSHPILAYIEDVDVLNGLSHTVSNAKRLLVEMRYHNTVACEKRQLGELRAQRIASYADNPNTRDIFAKESWGWCNIVLDGRDSTQIAFVRKRRAFDADDAQRLNVLTRSARHPTSHSVRLHDKLCDD